jgi:hypothetical protein
MKCVCKKNPNSIIKWQLTSPSAGTTISISSNDEPLGVRSSDGSVQMMTVPQVAPPQFPPHPYQHPYFGYYGHPPPITAPYVPPQLPAPPQPQQLVGDSSTSTPPGAYNKQTTSQGHRDGALGKYFLCALSIPKFFSYFHSTQLSHS